MNEMRFQLSIKLCKRGAALLDQQLWCLGRDIFHADGNALIRYGMTCHRVPQGQQGGHAYSQQLGASSRVVVWGFGLFCGDDALGGIMMRRFEFSPHWCPRASLTLPIWRIDQVPAVAPPRGQQQIERSLGLMARALTWLEDYEAWAGRALGRAHREAVLNARQIKPVCPPAGMCDAWRALRAEVLSPGANRAAPRVALAV